MKPPLKGVLSCESTCAATLRRRWWRVLAVEGCTPTTPSCLIILFGRRTWKVKAHLNFSVGFFCLFFLSQSNSCVIFICAAGQRFQCSHCSKRFATERLLRDHMRTHGQSHQHCSIVVISYRSQRLGGSKEHFTPMSKLHVFPLSCSSVVGSCLCQAGMFASFLSLSGYRLRSGQE